MIDGSKSKACVQTHLCRGISGAGHACIRAYCFNLGKGRPVQ
jgi:hypothetical protein